MRVTRIDPVNDTKAEGTIDGFAYDTQLVNIDGVALHLWTMSEDEPTTEEKEKIRKTAHRMRIYRDVVYATWSTGSPSGFWAHVNI